MAADVSATPVPPENIWKVAIEPFDDLLNTQDALTTYVPATGVVVNNVTRVADEVVVPAEEFTTDLPISILCTWSALEKEEDTPSALVDVVAEVTATAAGIL